MENRSVRTPNYKTVDHANCRVADMTLLLQPCIDEARTAALRRQQWVKQLRKKGYLVKEAYLSTSEIVRIRLMLRRSAVEVLNVICIQNCPADDDVGEAAAFFWERLLDAAEDFTEHESDPMWADNARYRRRSAESSPVARFMKTGKPGLLSAALEYTKDMIGETIDRFPIDPVLRPAVRDSAIRDAEHQLRSFVGQPLGKGAASQAIERISIQSTLRGLSQHIQGLLNAAEKEQLKRESNLERLLRVTFMRAARDAPIDGARQVAYPHLVWPVCSIIAETRLREERGLRTFLMLKIGGAFDASKYAKRVLSRLRRELERDHPGYEKRFRELTINLEDANSCQEESTSVRLCSWPAVEEIGKTLGRSWRQLRRNDPFREYIDRDDRHGLRAELFYFADQFRHDDSLWTTEYLVGFANGLCWLCGTDEKTWREWFGF